MRKVAVCWILLALVVFAQNSKEDLTAQETKLLVLERLWNEAQVGRDAGALQGMIGDRFVDTEWDGEVSDRDRFLADIRDPLFKPSSLSIQDVKVASYRDTAVITGIYHAKGTYQGKPYDHLGRFTDTWIYDSGKWQCVASHTSLLKK